MSVISKEQVQHVANLSRLHLSEEEQEQYTKDLNAILQFMDKLNELDTTDVAPTSHVLGITNVMREDEMRPSWPREEVLKNAPDQEEGQFKVPAVLGEKEE